MSLYCKSAGQARACGECRHNPLNQRDQPKGREIAPRIGRDLKCPQWQALPHAVTPSQTR